MNDEGSVAQIRARTNYFPNLVPSVPDSYHRLMDGTLLDIGGRSWRCISGYGHAPEHIALYCEDLALLIGGDMMLPRISTNVSVYEQEPEADALKLFLDSIDKFKPLPLDTLTLPAHGKPFTGLHVRIEQLHTHHRERLAEVMQACEAGPQRSGCGAGTVQARTGLAPDDFCHGRGGGALASAVVPEKTTPHSGRRWCVPIQPGGLSHLFTKAARSGL
jgi:glyoxylase-like metal-dependent hydrolase (beta-lactamase superfamily II)